MDPKEKIEYIRWTIKKSLLKPEDKLLFIESIIDNEQEDPSFTWPLPVEDGS